MSANSRQSPPACNTLAEHFPLTNFSLNQCMSMEGKEELKLIGIWLSPFVIRVKFALNLKEVEYENLEELNTWDKSELLLQSNPIYKKIPVLIHKGHPICESMIIVEYIDEVWPSERKQILPTNHLERAETRFWAYYIDDKLYPSFRDHVASATQEAKEKAAMKAAAALQPLENFFVQASNGKPFFGGDDIGFVDIALGCFLAWIRALEKLDSIKILSDKDLPKLATWAKHFCSHDAVKGVLPDTDKMIQVAEFFRMKLSSA